jgi:hypothetical protein
MIDHPDYFVLTTYFYALMLIVSVIFALRTGGTTEKASAWIALTASILSWMVSPVVSITNDWASIQPWLTIIDILTLIGFAAIALRSSRFWPLWAAAFQLVAVTTHFAIMVQPHVVPEAFKIALGFWAYPIIIMMVVASRQHAIRDRMLTDWNKR